MQNLRNSRGNNGTEKNRKRKRTTRGNRRQALDFVEGKAIARIKADDGAMIRFYLATKGKKRGFTYDEKLEADETAEDNNINVICDTPDAEPVDPATAEGDE